MQMWKIQNLNGKRFFNKTIYCRGLKNLHTPSKDNKDGKKQAEKKETKETDKSPKLRNPPEINAKTAFVRHLPAEKRRNVFKKLAIRF